MIRLDPIFLMYAFRYALGRKSYSVHDVATALIEHKDSIRTDWQQQVIRDITEAIAEGRAGMPMDEQLWLEVVAVFEGVQYSHPKEGT